MPVMFKPISTLSQETRTPIDTDGDGTIDRIEFDTDGDGTPDRIVHLNADGRWERVELDADDDGNIDQIDHYTFDDDGNRIRTRIDFDLDDDGNIDRTAHLDADGRWERVELDADDDGTIDRIDHYSFAADGTRSLTRTDFDTDGDGTTDRSEAYIYNGDGNRIRTRFDDDNDGNIDRIAFDDDGDGTPDRINHYAIDDDGTARVIRRDSDLDDDGNIDRTVHLNADGRWERVELDADDDGTIDRIDHYSFAADGTRSLTRSDFDDDGDGTADRSEAYIYDGDGNRIRTRFDDDNDGNIDRIAFDNDGDGTPDRINHYAIDDDGTARVIRTDFDLDDDGNIDRIAHLNADGRWERVELDADDDGNIDRIDHYSFAADGTRSLTRTDFDTDGDGTTDRSEAYIYNRDGNRTRTRFDDDNDGNIDRIAFDDDGDGTPDRINHYAIDDDGTARVIRRDSDLDDDGNIDRTVHLNADGRWERVELDADDDGTIDRIDHYSFAADGTRSLTRTDFDTDGDGTTDRSEAYIYDGDGNRIRTRFDDDNDGNIDRIAFDDDGDGTPDRINHYAIDDDGTGRVIRRDSDLDDDGNIDRIAHLNADGRWERVELDADDDGTIDRIDHYSFAADGTRSLTRTDFDTDGDGTADRSEAYIYNGDGNLIQTDFDDDNDGNIDRIAFDDDGDGTPDRINHYAIDDDGTARVIRTDFDLDDDGNIDRTVHLNADGRWERVDLDADDDGNIDRSDHYTFAADGTRSLTRSDFDDDGDGTTDRSEAYIYNRDGNRIRTRFDDDNDGNIDRIAFDDDGDGTPDRINHYAIDDDGTARVIRRDSDLDDDGNIDRTVHLNADGRWERVDLDADDDGNIDRSDHYTFAADGARSLTRTDFDVDDDGTADRSEAYTYNSNGTLIRTRFDDDNDGNIDRIAFDDDGDGTPDRINHYAIDDDGTARVIRRDSDLDDDGNIDRTVHLNADGRWERVDLDADDDGNIDRSDHYTFAADGARSLTRTETYTYNSDGTLIRTNFDDDADGNIDRAALDTDGDGTTDRTETYFYTNSRRTRTEFDDDADGNIDRVSVTENQIAAYEAAAADADGGPLSYSLSGTDAALFTIDAATGEVSFRAAPDFEAPGDDGGDNVYDIIVTASDGINSTDHNVAITVTNDNDNAPVFTSPATANARENQTAAYMASATDADGDTLVYSLSGTDAALFTIDAATGEVSFIEAPDFEAPGDDGGDNIYDIIVTASDGINSTNHNVAITVTNDNDNIPAFTSPATANAQENQVAAYEAAAADADGDPLNYSLSGTDAALFTIDANTGVVSFKAAPDFEAPGDDGGDNVYDIIVTASDDTNSTNQNVAITVTNENDNAPAFTSPATVRVAENQVAAYEAAAADADGDPLSYSLSGTDAALFTIDADTGVVSFRAAPDFEAPGDADGDNVYDIIVTASDGANSTEQPVAITVTDEYDLIPLSSLDGSNGFALTGIDTRDYSGTSVSSAGDVNGDGYDDLIIGADWADPNGFRSGETYIVYGGASAPGTGGKLDLSALDGTNGFILNGIDRLDRSGGSVSSAGDVNGDGYDDLIIGADWADPNGSRSGETYIVYGGASAPGTGGKLDLSALDGTNGFILNGIDADDRFGRSVSSAGDVNGDGYDDLIIGAYGGDPNEDSNAGEIYVIYGGPSAPGTNGVLDLSALSGTNGFTLTGIDGSDQSGRSVSSAGDVNGDGYDDLIIGAREADPNEDSNAGETYVVYGGASAPGTGGELDLSALDGTNGFILNGIDEYDRSGFSVSSAGDVNGDGYDDLIIGAYRADPGGDSDAGETYVIYGGASAPGTDGVLDLSTLDGRNGLILNGIDGSDFSGASVSSAGDVNGDGYDDLIIGAWGGDPNGDSNAGETYVVYGGASAPGTGGRFNLSALDGTNGFILNGIDEEDRSGFSVSSAGDVNGDGYDDLIIGAYGGDPNEDSGAGETYVIYGGATGTESLVPVTAQGTAAVDNFTGNAGADSFTGIATDDVVRGGAGDDVTSVTALDFAAVDGGTGRDTLILDGSGLSLDLTGAGHASVDSVEVFDLSGTGSNTLVLDALAVFDVTEERAGGVASLDVLGDADDRVDLGGSNFDLTGTVTEDGTAYTVYRDGNAQLRVEDGVQVVAIPVFTSPAVGKAAENQIAAYEAVAADAYGGPLSYSLSGTDAALFTIDANTGEVSFRAAPDFETPGDDDGDNVYDIIVTASNGTRQTDQSVAITVTNENDNVPAFTSPATANAQENQTAAYMAAATDADGDALVYSLSGTDAALFTIDADTGEVSFIEAPDFEAPGDDGGDNIYDIIVTASDGINSTDHNVAITVTNENDNAPTFTSPATANVQENQTAAYMAAATDADGDTLVYSLSGTDAALFTIDADTGEVSFMAAPDFEAPGDDGGDNVYDIIVTASDGINSTDHNVAITVTNDNVPVFTSPAAANAQENQTAAYMAVATDADGDALVYSLSGTDAALFTIDADTGEVSFIEAPDFEAPGDDGGDNVYDIIVTASDGINSTDHNVAITVTNDNDNIPVFTSPATANAQENQTVAYEAAATDADGDTLVYSLSGTDAALFTIDANTGEVSFIAAPDFEAPGDDGGDNIYDIIVTASDGINSTDHNVAITVTNDNDNIPVFTSPATANAQENQTAAYMAAATDTDGDTLVYSLSGTDAALFTIDANTGEVSFRAAPDFEAPGDADGDNVYDIIVTASDGTNQTDQPVAITVTNDNVPAFTSPATVSVAENQSAAYEAAADADGGPLSYSLSGTDAALFMIDANTGEVSFRAAPDFEAPGDADGDNVYDIIVTASDDTNSTEQNVAITVTDEYDLIPLSSLDGTNGFILNGIDADDYSGRSVSSAGDVNGDGYDDLIIGADWADPNGDSRAGETYVIYGGASAPGTDGVLDLSALDGTNGFILNGIDAYDRSGRSVSSAGDVNGDGYDDLIIGAYRADSDGDSAAGEIYVIYGGASAPGTGGRFNLSALDGTNGFILNGIDANDRSGTSVSSAGDVNGDGYDDLIIGAPGADPNGDSAAGEIYVIYGGASAPGTNGMLDLSALSGTNGFILNGIDASDQSGFSVSSAGDVNGDGYGDLIIGAVGADPNGSRSGETYVVYGGANAPGTGGVLDLGALDGTNGFILTGIDERDQSGRSVSSAGDVNGDGYDDLIIGANIADPGGDSDAGETYIVYGGASAPGTNGVLDLSALDGTNGFILNGIDADDRSGRSVSSAGDVNGDGYDDLIIGAYQADPNEDSAAGETYVVYGGASAPGTGGELDLSALDGTNGFILTGIDEADQSGRAVSSAGDVNGDGYDDLIIGAYGGDPNEDSDAGEAYILYGGATGTESLTPVTASGTAAVDNFTGNAGADSFTGIATDDVVHGGAGDDVTSVTALDFAAVDGGTGRDTLILDGADLSLDLTGAGHASVDSVEIFDLSGTGSNTLVLDAQAVFDVTEEREGGVASVDVLGDADDRVDLGGSNFILTGTATEDGVTYNVYSDGNAQLRVEDGVQVQTPPVVFTSPAAVSARENQTAAYMAAATDADGDTLVYSLSGTDAALFTIDTDTGEVSFIEAPDFEAPGDDGGDNVYDITVTASDGTNSTNHNVAIRVTNENDNAPTFTSPATANVQENQTAAYMAAATDAEGDTLVYSLSGTDAALFTIDADTGEVSFMAAPDFEAPGDDGGDNVYDIIVTASDGINSTDHNVAITVTNDNVPAFTSPATANARENQTAAYMAAATDADGDTLVYSLSGTDAALFTIDADTGEVSFIEAPDFEAPGDDGGDNVYDIIVTASDGINSTDHNVAITVTNDNDNIPVFTSPATANAQENQTAAYMAAATDADGDTLVYSLSGTDAALFTIDANTGEVSFRAAPDFEAPGDADGDNVYDIIVTASDGTNQTDQPVAITVTNDNVPAFTSPATVSVAENQSAAYEAAADADGGPLSYSLSGTDAALFMIDANTGEVSFRAAPDFEAPGDADGDNVYDIIVTASDDTNSTEQNVAITVTDEYDLIPLSSLDGTNGFILNGIDADDYSGRSVSSAGDVNGDGYDDLIIGADWADPNGNSSGETYIVYGGAGAPGTDGVLDLSALDGTNGFILNGIDAYDRSGRSVSSAGDVNGDGYDDLIIGTYRADPDGDSAAGETYVVYGGASAPGTGGRFNLSALDGTNGFILNGIDAGDNSGSSVSSAGDVNGDGYDDLIIGAFGADGSVGETYVVYGGASAPGTGGVLDLSALNGTNGFILNGIDASDLSGFSVSSAGDVNGDGYDDLIIGVLGGDPNGDGEAGETYIVYGGASAPGTRGVLDLSDLDGTNGFILNGIDAGDNSGSSVSSAGDVNGDGYDDLIIGARFADPNGDSAAGETYLVYGGASAPGTDGVLNLGALDGTNGFILTGIDAGDRSGTSVSSAGDVNGDGYDDLIIGAFGADGSVGETYVVYGGASAPGTGGVLDLSALDGTNGFILNGIDEDDRSGFPVSSAGDVNGDGYDDLIIGARYGDPNGNRNAGETYVVYGGATGTESLVPVTAQGTAAVDNFTGNAGADSFTGIATNDVVRGGAGDDVTSVTALDFAAIDGGTGRDTLILDGADLSLDLTGAGHAGVDSVEIFDLSGTGSNSLVLDALAVFGVTEERAGGVASLDVLGDADDRVDLGGSNFILTGTATEDGVTYNVYSDGNAQLRVEDGVQVQTPPVVFTSPAAVSARENQTAAYMAAATDADGDTLVYSLSGTDAALFTINANTGEVSFIEAPDFEAPGDDGGDNVYDIIVTASDGINSTDHNVAITVTNDNDNAPVFTSLAAANAQENQTVAYEAAATDADGDTLVYSLSGTDAALFTIDANTGEVSFIEAPDFEAPGDDGGDNVYDIIVTASDGTNSTDHNVAITVTNDNDNAPTFTSPATANAQENQTAAYMAAATDADGDTLVYSLSGTDAALFTIDTATGEVSFMAAPDFEAPGDDGGDNIYDIIVTASDGATDTEQAVAITVTNENDNAPVFTSPATANAQENQTAAYMAAATDADGDTLVYSLSGTDAARFTIDAATGEVSFIEAPDFEAPGDDGGGNVYDIIVTASDGTNRTDHNVAITVTNDNDNIPVFTSPAAANARENQTAAYMAAATDADGDALVYSLSGTDAALFTINANTGEVSFIEAPDFEAPGDDDRDNVYDIIVTASDGTNSTDHNVAITVTNENDNIPVFTSPAAVSVAENQTAAYEAAAADADGDALVYSLSGTDAALFVIDTDTGEVSFITAPDFEMPGDADRDNVYDITVTASDGDNIRNRNVAITVTDNNIFFTSPAAVSAQENQTVAYEAAATHEDGDPLVYSLSGTDAALFTIDTDTGEVSFIEAPDFEAPGDDGGDNVYDIIVTAFDGTNRTDYNVSITVTDEYDLIPLSSLDGSNGFILAGIDAGDQSGFSVSSAGDVNGDGYGDLIIGAVGADPNGNSSGETYIVYGGAGAPGTDGVLDLSTLDGRNGFILNGIDANDQSGRSVSSAGDVNGDGYDDLIIGAREADPNGDDRAGETYIIYGGANAPGTDGVLDLGALDGTNGFILTGIDRFDFSGSSVSSAGDVNGDGYDDLIIGASFAEPNGRNNAGETYIIYGGASAPGTGGVLDLGALDGSNGFILNGIDRNDYSGISVSSAGDVNGDGYDDLIIGAPFADPNGDSSGETYIVYGGASAPGTRGRFNLSMLDGSNGFILTGIDANDQSGRSVSSAGDVNGDGYDDLIIGARYADPNGDSGAGETYIIYGGANALGTGGVLDLSTLNGTNGFILNGINASDRSGFSVSSAGDVNGDGYDDLIIGADQANSGGDNRVGETYLVYGGANAPGTDGVLDLSALDGTNGFILNGIDEEDRSGFSVSSAGDVNGDGYDDLIIGARYAAPNGNIRAGETYVIYGGATGTESLVPVTAQGTAAVDNFTGNAGDDNFTAIATNDVVRGGAGNDIISVTALDFAAIDGGTGQDTLVLDGAGLSLDLTGAGHAGVDSVELFDLSGTGTNSLVLDALAVFDVTEEREGGAASLDVLGDADDRVELSGSNFALTGTATEDGVTYNIYRDGNAQLRVETGVQVVTIPGFTSPAAVSVAEGQTAVYEAAATDADGDTLVYSLSGTDAALFTIDATTGEVSFIAAPDFEMPGDTDGDNVYDITVTASDGTNSTNHNVAIRVTNENENIPVFTSPAAASAQENQTAAYMAAATDADGDTLVYSLSGTDAALFTIDANTGAVSFRAAPDFEVPGDADGDNVYDIIVTASDDANSTEQPVAITVTDVNDLVPLSSLDGTNGFILNGIDEDDRSGRSVSSAGDVNGDGYDDLIIGAYRADPNGDSRAGETYVVYGGASAPGTGGRFNLSALDGTNGFILNGIDAGDRSGFSVSSAGDVNGDGYDDLIIGADGADQNGYNTVGETYVVYGGASAPGTGGELDLSSLDGTNGFILNGIDGSDQSGRSVSSAGDVNGDGYGDLIIGAGLADPNGDSAAGEIYVVYGGASAPGTGGRFNLSALDGTNGFILNGIDANDRSGTSVSSAGDVNGDGYDDLIIGASGADPNGDSAAGEIYVIYGGASAPGTNGMLDLSALSGTNGFILNGIDASDLSGFSVSSAGDVNGDGYDDLIIGARYADPNGETSGESYVIYGGANAPGIGGVLDLSALDGTNGFILNGIDAGDNSGWSVSSAGDVNGDGYDDLIIAARSADPNGRNSAGETYIIYGGASAPGSDGVLDLSSLALDGSTGFIVNGIDAFDYSGISVSSAGDVNGDGYDDLIIGAHYADPNGRNSAGETYIVYGGAKGTESLTPVTAQGIAAADNFTGNAGDDSFTDIATDDVVRGGAGDDTIRVTALDFAAIDGGTGQDTLVLDGAGLALDLTGTGHAGVDSVEVFDLSGTGANSLVLDALAVFDVTEEREGGAASLDVLGDADDRVDLGGGNFILTGTATADGVTYNVYRDGNAEVRVEDEVMVTLAAAGAQSAESKTDPKTDPKTDIRIDPVADPRTDPGLDDALMNNDLWDGLWAGGIKSLDQPVHIDEDAIFIPLSDPLSFGPLSSGSLPGPWGDLMYWPGLGSHPAMQNDLAMILPEMEIATAYMEGF